MSKNLIWRLVGDTIVAVHTKNPPSQAEWEGFLLASEEGNAKGALVHTEGGSPSAFQRKQLRDFVERKGAMRGAILTDSMIARMAITAINLFTKGLSTPFAPLAIDEALVHLQTPREAWAEVKKTLTELKQELNIATPR